MMNSFEELTLRIKVEETSPAERQWLDGEIRESAEATGNTVQPPGEERLVDPLSVALYVVVAYATIDLIYDLVDRVQRRGQSFVVVDAREEDVSITVRSEVPELRGQVLLISREGDELELKQENAGEATARLLKRVLEP